MIPSHRLRAAYLKARSTLLAERNADGFWIGELSSSALSTATAVGALTLVDRPKHQAMIATGMRWLVDHQNADGGWGDTVKSFSNISTTMLIRAAFALTGSEATYAESLKRCEAWLSERAGATPDQRAEAIRRRYGKDRTFAVPILTMSALAGLMPWNEIPRLPFELACLPQSWYRFARLPVVSYALPALIAIGQCIHRHRGTWNPLTKILRWLGKNRSLRVLEQIQPSSGGYLEATPLTSFVVMSLASLDPLAHSPARRVIDLGVDFVVQSMRPDGSWPIDTNLSIWVTTLSINALAAAGDLDSLDRQDILRDWLLAQQMKLRHPYTGAPPGGWGWSHLPGSVPDCDDTPGAIVALRHLGVSDDHPAIVHGKTWMAGLQNSDRGFPTFCRGWGTLPFDRSGADLTAHALRAIEAPDHPGFVYLARQQRSDGSWLPLWFGNQHAPDDINPVYGTSRILAAYRDSHRIEDLEAKRGVAFLLSLQNNDGGWGGARETPSSVEETALVVEVLIGFGDEPRSAVMKGIEYLVQRVEDGTFTDASPIGFYFAKLWYFEKLYPIIFTVAALGRACQTLLSKHV